MLNADWIAEGREIVAHRVFGLVARARGSTVACQYLSPGAVDHPCVLDGLV